MDIPNDEKYAEIYDEAFEICCEGSLIPDGECRTVALAGATVRR
jgi:hypothetical protein